MPPLLPPLVALVAGVLTAPYLHPEYVWLCVAPALPIGIARPKLAVLVIFLLGAGLRSNKDVQPPVIHDDGYPARAVVRLEGPPEWREPGYYLNVRMISVGGRSIGGRARLSFFPGDAKLDRLFRDFGLGSGDRLEILVRLRPPRVYRNPGVFNYRQHLERQDIYWTGSIRNPRLIQVLARGIHGGDHVRAWISDRIGSYFSGDRTIQALVLGMVLGQRRRLPAADARRFQAAGLVHLRVVSGFNLAVVAASALWLGRRLPFGRYGRTGSKVFALVAVLGYAALVEGNTPVVRATLMACLLISGTLLDRGYSIANALSATALVILAIEPRALEDPSFQLTFLAVLSILFLAVPLIRWGFGWLGPALRDLANEEIDAHLPPDIVDWRVSRRLWCELRGWPTWIITVPWRVGRVLGEAAIVTVTAQFVLVMFMVESYHRISPVTLPLNVLGALVAAVITPMGLLLIGLPGFIGVGVAWVMKALLGLLVVAVKIGLEIPGASVRVGSPPVWIWVPYAVVIVGWTLAVGYRRLLATGLCFSAAICLQGAIIFADFSPSPPEHTTLTLLDVGQGDSILIELTNGKRILVDGGGVSSGGYRSLVDEGTFSIGEDVVSPYLFKRGIRTLDAVVLTHAHHDHIDGLFDVLQNFEVREVWLGRNPMVPQYRDLLEEIYRRQIPIRWIWSGQQIGPFTVLHPPRTWTTGTRVQNDDSVVLQLDSEGTSVLLTGDLERSIPLPGPVDILKIPHHGSKNTQLIVQATIPIVSVGASNPFGHPHPSKLPALRTDILGAIQIVLGPGRPIVTFPGL